MFYVKYPQLALERGEQGLVRYRVNVDPEGRASDCEVIRSSGFARLDRLTCTAAVHRARFTPTRDESGQRVRSVYEGQVVWRLR
jgi:protein TonB